MKNEIISRLEDLQKQMEQAMDPLFKPVYKPNTINGILQLEGLTSTEKVILMDVLANGEQGKFKGVDSQERLKIGKQSYNNHMRRLRNKGYVRETKRGYYKLNTQLF